MERTRSHLRRAHCRAAAVAAVAATTLVFTAPRAHADDGDLSATVCVDATVDDVADLSVDATVNATTCPAPTPAPVPPSPIPADVNAVVDAEIGDGIVDLDGDATGTNLGATPTHGVVTLDATGPAAPSGDVPLTAESETIVTATGLETFDLAQPTALDTDLLVCHRTATGGYVLTSVTEATWISTRSARGGDVLSTDGASCPTTAGAAQATADDIATATAAADAVAGTGSTHDALESLAPLTARARTTAATSIATPQGASSSNAAAEETAAAPSDDGTRTVAGQRSATDTNAPSGANANAATATDDRQSSRKWAATQVDDLPVTGVAIASVVILGLALVAAGTALTGAARRRAGVLHTPS